MGTGTPQPSLRGRGGGMTGELDKAGRKLQSARKAQEAALESARLAAIDALAQGFTEVEVSKTLGVDRMTVRKWAGKR